MGRASTAASNADGKTTGLLGRVRTWWRNVPIMRAFFCYSLLWVVIAGLASIVIMEALLTAYDALDRAGNEDIPMVDSGPYVYDVETDELVPAVTIDMVSDDASIVFIGMRSGVGRATENGDGYSQHVSVAGNDRPVVYATMEMLRRDTSLEVMDWGGNYTAADYHEAGGNPYDPQAISVDDLAAYDERERQERAQISDVFGNIGLSGDGITVSNIGYYVSQPAYHSDGAALLALRLAAGFTPFVVGGILAFALFRRFYQKRLREPLATLRSAADRVAHQDLDFTVGEVRGREFGSLATAFERMRTVLAQAQRELWETAEERRRLNAAFAHDLRTPITVLKGTLEMARARVQRRLANTAATGSCADDRSAAPASVDDILAKDCARGEDAAGDATASALATLDTLDRQSARLESYALAMTNVTKLDERPVARERVTFGEAAADLAKMAESLVHAAGKAEALHLDIDRGDRGAGAEARTAAGDGVPPEACVAPGDGTVLELDMPLVEEAVANVVNNACRYARSRVGLRIRVLPAGGLEVRVADDGTGFTPEALHRGTEAFFSEAKSAEHFGLGLAISRILTTLHGGALELANDGMYGGACVTFSFASHGRSDGD